MEFVLDNPTTSPARPSSTNVLSLGVPEPSTWALLLLGFAGLGDAARLRAGAPHWPPSTGADFLPAERISAAAVV